MSIPCDHTMSVLSDKAVHILSSAERCFARAGFHRTTMQDIAREAQMSPGNLYRYFPSKAEMVQGLVMRDRAMMNERIEKFRNASDFRSGFLQLCRSFICDEPVERVVLWIEIWIESVHNPTIAEVVTRCDAEIFMQINTIYQEAMLNGHLPKTFNLAAFHQLIMSVSNGLHAQRCLDPDFDGEWALSMMGALFDAVVSGALALPSKSARDKAAVISYSEETMP